jgi:hypothetical protein
LSTQENGSEDLTYFRPSSWKIFENARSNMEGDIWHYPNIPSDNAEEQVLQGLELWRKKYIFKMPLKPSPVR